MDTPLIALRSVVKDFGVPGGRGTTSVLAGVDLEVRPGESVAVVGPSGCGKSTLLGIMGALMVPTSGKVQVLGEDLAGRDPDALATLRNLSIGFVFQSHHLLPQCTALENALLPTLARRDRPDRRALQERARRLLDEVGLSDRVDHRPSQLSGGECQRVAVVRALINGPRLILADEPTGSLDGEAGARMGDLLCALTRTDATALVVVTHNLDLASKMQRVLELREGRLQPARLPS
jgi:predicted ABC-type transport system involved in lysophospholipase L1 biosynthesis ATPase subunit